MAKHRLPKVIRALGSRNYRLFFSAQAISLTGLWMQRIAMGWLIYRLTDSQKALGLIDFCSSFPSLFIAPMAGALIARWDLRYVLIVTQGLLMVGAAMIGGLTLAGWITYGWIVALAILLGLVNAFDMPVRQSLVVYMVDDIDDMPNAVALNSSLFNVARLIGPTIAGFTIHRVGEGICFLINAAAYAVTMFAVKIMHMHVKPVAVKGKRDGDSYLKDFIKGFQLIARFPAFKYVLLMVIVAGVFCFPYIVLMPAVVRDMLHGDSRTMGFMLFSVGIGALSGSILMAVRHSPVGLELWVSRSAIAFGAAVALFSLSHWKWLSMILVAPVGFFMVTTLIAANTFLQTLVDDENRSRLMSLYIVASVGIPPFGSLLIGWLAELVGTAGALCASGLTCICLCMYLFRNLERCRRQVLRAFRDKGYNLAEAKPAKKWMTWFA